MLGATDKSQLVKYSKSEQLRIVYAGNIGTLYDFDTLISAVERLDFKVRLEIIGDGDKKRWLENKLADSDIEFKFHGIVYDEKTIAEIVSKADFGFNGFLDTTASLSYKSVMYMSYGLPIINSMEGDLWNFVEDEGLGFNYVGGDVSNLTECLIKASSVDHEKLRASVISFFNKNLKIEVVSEQLLEVFRNEENF